MSSQTKINNLDYLIDQAFKINSLFVYLLKMKTVEYLFQNIVQQMLK